eukprot:scaffold97630_cov69-Phaeocystis_antarctica.AAC.3
MARTAGLSEFHSANRSRLTRSSHCSSASGLACRLARLNHVSNFLSVSAMRESTAVGGTPARCAARTRGWMRPAHDTGLEPGVAQPGAAQVGQLGRDVGGVGEREERGEGEHQLP